MDLDEQNVKQVVADAFHYELLNIQNLQSYLKSYIASEINNYGVLPNKF